MTATSLRWLRGGEAVLEHLDEDRVRLRSTIPSAPGSLIEAELPSTSRFRVKVARCKRAEAGFVIEGRLVDATRAVRLELTPESAPAAPTPPTE